MNELAREGMNERDKEKRENAPSLNMLDSSVAGRTLKTGGG